MTSGRKCPISSETNRVPALLRALVLKASWCKGGRTRWIPVLTDAQRKVLDEARRLVGSGSLIPAERSYRQQLPIYERQVAEAGMARMHSLRHGYAIRRYEHLTGWKALVRGGPSRRDLKDQDREADRRARIMISRELGHGRPAVTAQYVGWRHGARLRRVTGAFETAGVRSRGASVSRSEFPPLRLDAPPTSAGH